MSKVWIEEETLTGIADAIRTKKGTTDLIETLNMKSEILSISGGGEISHMVVGSIIADGASYIKTDIYPSPLYSIEMECRLHTIVDDRYDFLFGTRFDNVGRWQARFDTATAGNPNTFRVQRSKYYSESGSGNWVTSEVTKQEWMDYKVFKLEKANAYIDGELIGSFTDDTTYYRAHYPFSLYLFAVNDTDEINEDPITNCGHIECKYVKIWDANDELILSLIPVVKSDGTVCMYDEVHGEYYYNAGTGEFSYSE